MTTAEQKDGLHAREMVKRERAFDPRERWQSILSAIDWAEQQLPPEKRRNRPRVPKNLRVISGAEPK